MYNDHSEWLVPFVCILLIGLVFVGVYLLEVYTCSRSAGIYKFENKYDLIVGCLIKPEKDSGEWVRLEDWFIPRK
jgi:hypothetical protein